MTLHKEKKREFLFTKTSNFSLNEIMMYLQNLEL